MLRRPLPVMLGASAADYLLWTWFSSRGPAVLALVSGLALAPLLLALVWMLAVRIVRVLSSYARSLPASVAARTRGTRSPLGAPRTVVAGGLSSTGRAAARGGMALGRGVTRRLPHARTATPRPPTDGAHASPQDRIAA